MSEKNKLNPKEAVFEADGQKYCFVAGKFQLRLTEGEPDDGGMLTVVTCTEALEKPSILAHLISVKSGVIEAIEGTKKKGGK